ncbi:SIR2 family protein [Hoyosella sp. YIM 151337]|uniref:SIR2 family protein n=1 Tax=Hoyosella sp. YIM 151337 TaxID=2992742 RepID=UPI0022361798|nr:SIR2 family protein [Hoyosella sp. YIM 151337]MCW4354167.1 SIR2 family protein [Hoyosella sp. YIM 151337]
MKNGDGDSPAEVSDASSPTNSLKVRDDVKAFRFSQSPSGEFEAVGGELPPWAGNSFDQVALRRRIEPWLTSLFQSDHLSLLVGSGLPTGVARLSGANAANMEGGEFQTCGQELSDASKSSALLAGRDQPNIEDRIRVATQLLRGLEILGDARANDLRDELSQMLKQFADSILCAERELMEAEPSKRTHAFATLVSFLMSFASRTGNRDRLNIFTTNYDRLIEVGAELAGLHLLDRFVGSVTPMFRSSRLDLDLHYNPPGIRGEPRFVEGVVRFTKLHGSIDWISKGQAIRRVGIPYGAKIINPYLEAPGLNGVSANSLMIFPNAAKDRETAEYPYVELFRDFAAAIARPNSTIVTYGYSFGDDHINRVIRDALTIPSTHLVIISFDDKLGRIQQVLEEWGRRSQVSLLVGPELGNISNLTSQYLPKPSIDATSRRMADLLRHRYGEDNHINQSSSGDSSPKPEDGS